MRISSKLYDGTIIFYPDFPLVSNKTGEIDTVYEFGRQEHIDKFVATSDSDHNEGFSHCSFKSSPAGYGLFSGVLDSTVPKQGKISRAGYCNITSQRVMVCIFGI